MMWLAGAPALQVADAFIGAVASLLPVAACRSLSGTGRWGWVSFPPCSTTSRSPRWCCPRAATTGACWPMRRFGSSAGVALASAFPEAKDTLRWLRTAWFVPVGFLLGFAVLLGLTGWRPVRSWQPVGLEAALLRQREERGQMGPSVLALPLGSLRSLKSDRLLAREFSAARALPSRSAQQNPGRPRRPGRLAGAA